MLKEGPNEPHPLTQVVLTINRPRMYEQNQAQQKWLESFIAQHDGIAGTVHVQRGEDLYLTAAHNIPPSVVAIVTHVPQGKGMAGLAQVKKEPVQTCNLQTDETGNVKPGAKAVDAQAAIALPVLNRAGTVRAVVGIAWSKEGEIGPAEEHAMMKLAAALPQ
jgi:L-methionine (R)-S-oxide reductase